MAIVLQTKQDVKAAMYRDDVGDIDFIYGTPGKGSKFKKGYGIAHIKAKRDYENGSGIDTLNKLVEVIAKGTDTEIQHANGGNGEYRLKIHYDGYTAILSSKTEKANSWLLTGWEDKKEAPVNARSEGYDSSTATTATPTLTRRSRETGTSSTPIIPQETTKGNKPDKLRNQLSDTPEVDTKYSVREAHEQLTRSKEDLKTEIKEAFPNAKEINDEGDRMTFTMPNSCHIVVDLKNEIVLTDKELAQAKKDHHIDDNGNVVVEGYAEARGKEAYIALAQGSREGTGFHEAYYIAEDAVLTDREKAAIKKAIPDAEERADKYAEWVEARKHGRGTAWGKLFQKIKDFAAKMKTILTGAENVHNVFRKIESGKVWERNAMASNATWTSVTNATITGKTRVPIVDVSNWERMDLTNPANKKAIIEELKGISFDFIGNLGRFSTKLDSKYFVTSSNSIQIHLKTRQKVFSNVGENLKMLFTLKNTLMFVMENRASI